LNVSGIENQFLRCCKEQNTRLQHT